MCPASTPTSRPTTPTTTSCSGARSWRSARCLEQPAPYLTAHTAPGGYTYLSATLVGRQYVERLDGAGRLYPRRSHSSSYDVNADATWHIDAAIHGQGPTRFHRRRRHDRRLRGLGNLLDQHQCRLHLGQAGSVSRPGLPAGDTTAAYLNNKFSWSWGGKQTSPDRESYAKVDFDYELGNDLFKDVTFGARATDHTRKLIDDALCLVRQLAQQRHQHYRPRHRLYRQLDPGELRQRPGRFDPRIHLRQHGGDL